MPAAKKLMAVELRKCHGLKQKFEAWMASNHSEELLHRVWPVAWWHCDLIPKPPEHIMLGPTPVISEESVIDALLKCGWPLKAAKRLGRDAGYTRSRKAHAFGAVAVGQVISTRCSGAAYFERYFCGNNNNRKAIHDNE